MLNSPAEKIMIYTKKLYSELLSCCSPSFVVSLFNQRELMKVIANTPMQDTLRDESHGLTLA
jgi:hypothetical protein